MFLSRKLYSSRSIGRIIKSEFTKLDYPWYWHYDILFGLKVMAEADYISNPSCQDALYVLRAAGRMKLQNVPSTAVCIEKQWKQFSDI